MPLELNDMFKRPLTGSEQIALGKLTERGGIVAGTCFDPPRIKAPQVYVPAPPRTYAPPPVRTLPATMPVADQVSFHGNSGSGAGCQSKPRPPASAFDDMPVWTGVLGFLMIGAAYTWLVSSVLQFFGVPKESAETWAALSFWGIFALLLVLSVLGAIWEAIETAGGGRRNND